MFQQKKFGGFLLGSLIVHPYLNGIENNSFALFNSPLPRPRHVDPPPALTLLSTPPPPDLIPRTPLCRPPSTDWPVCVVRPCPQGLPPLLPLPPVQRLVRTSSWAFQRQWQRIDNVRFLAPISAPVLIPAKKFPRKKIQLSWVGSHLHLVQNDVKCCKSQACNAF